MSVRSRRLVSASGRVVAVLVLLLVVLAIPLIASDVASPEQFLAGLGTALGMAVICVGLGVAAPLLTFHRPHQHLVLVSATTMAVVGVPLFQNLVVLVIVLVTAGPWSLGLRRADPAPHWTRGEWAARALTFAVMPALAMATALWGGLLRTGDEHADDTPGQVLGGRIEAVLESVAVLGPAWVAAAVAVSTRGRVQAVAIGVCVAGVFLGLVFLRSSLNPYTPGA